MSFAFSSGTITQSGTDTSLSGLTGLVGVNIQDFGTGIGGYKIYILTGVRLNVGGTLSFNPNIERIVFDSTCLVQTLNITGILTIDGTQTFNSAPVSFRYYAVTFLRVSTSFFEESESSLRVQSTGTFNLTRAFIYTNSPIHWLASSTVTIVDGGLVSSRVTSNLVRIRNFCSSLTISGCFLSNLSLDFFRQPISLSRLQWEGALRSAEVVSVVDGGLNTQVVFSGLSILGTTYDLSSWSRADIKIINALQGVLYKVAHEESGIGSATQITCQVALKIKNSATSAFLTTGSFFVRDTNNSNRLNAIYASGTVDFTSDRTYYTNANGSGVFPNQEILCYVIRGGTPANLAGITYDYRGIENSASNVFNFIFAAYGFLPSVRATAIFGTAAGGAFAADVSVLVDARINQANTVTVAAYTTQTSSTFENIYDFCALDKTLLTGIEFPTPSSRILESSDGKSGFLNYGLTINSALTGISINHGTGILSAKAINFSTAYNQITVAAGKNIVLSQSGVYSTIEFVFASNTSVVNVSSGSTNLQNWIFPSGLVINNTSASAATVLVTVTAGITTTSTGGGAITLSAPVISVTAANFANGVIVQASYRQIFTIASTAIAVATDIITLGNDSNGSASAFRTTSPNTLIRFSLAVGATLPVSTPQIQDGGLYYFRSGGQLSITEGGTAINFTTQGAGNFVLIAETELNNSIVSGGLGYSAALTLTTGSLVRVKAVHFTETAGVATTSKFFDAVFAWSSVSGITIIDVVNNAIASSKELIHEQIVATASLTLESAIDNNVGTSITSITLPDSGSAVTSLALALEGSGKIQVNANKSDGLISWQEFFLWGCYVRSTAVGIRLVSAATFEANNFYNYRVLGIEIDDIILTPLYFVGAVGLSSDGKGLVSPTTTGAVILNALSRGTGAIVSVSGGGGTAPTVVQIRQELDASSTRLIAIDAKTSGLNFTGANVQAIAIAVSDKSGYTLSQTFPANFAALGINVSGHVSRVTLADTVSDKAGFSLSSAQTFNLTGSVSGSVGSVTSPVTVGTNNDKSNYALSQAFPANFSSLAIANTTGAITVGTNTDKAGYGLSATQSFTLTGNITGNVSGSVGSVAGAVILPTIPANWINAAGINAAAFTAAKFAVDAIDSNAIAASAISEIQTGLATTSAIAAIPTTPLLAGDTRLNTLVNLDATVSSRLATTGYTAPLTAAQLWGATIASLTTVGTIGKLLADNVNATISSRATPSDVASSGGFTAGDRTALQAIPINPLLTGDARLTNLDATISSRSIYSGSDTAGTTTLLTRVTGSVLLTSSYTAPNNTGINDIVAKITKLYKRQGLLPGITATVSDAKTGIPGSLVTSDGDINQTLTQISDGVVRIST